MKTRKFRELSDAEHVIKRPSMYIGSVDLTNSEEYILENGKIQRKNVQYVPGLVKVINEIIDNSVDEAIFSEFKVSTKISVKMDNKHVEITDNGSGIPVKKNEAGHQIAERCWGAMKSGGNFDDDENRTQIGMNGVGSFATNCFSKKFVGSTDDGKKAYTVTFENAVKKSDKLQKSTGKTGVNVKFWPDLDKFGLEEIDSIHMDLIKQRLINLSLSYPKISFYFNSKKVSVSSFKNYVAMFSENFEYIETENYSFAVLPNSEDDFKHFSYVNGLKIPNAGTHISVISNNVVSYIREKLQKKYKTIKPGDIKNKLMVVAFLRNVKNTKFNSQTKEEITNSVTEIQSYYNESADLDWQKFAEKVFKNKAIIEPITEVYRIKEEFKKRQELKNIAKPKKRFDADKYVPPIGEKKYLLIVEGDCIEENTEIMMGDLSKKKIKDVEIGDKVLSGDLSIQHVLAQAKLMKKSLNIKTPTTEIQCSPEHRFNVYDTKDDLFKFVKAKDIKDNVERYKFLKSKISITTKYNEVKDNFPDDKTLYLYSVRDGHYIKYTDDDYFVIVRDGSIIKVQGTDIVKGDLITSSLDN